MLNLLLAASFFTEKVSPIVRIVCMVVILLLSIGLIITTLLQSSADENGATAVTGQESYYSQNKGESRDGKLKKLTIIFASILVACILVYFITWVIM